MQRIQRLSKGINMKKVIFAVLFCAVLISCNVFGQEKKSMESIKDKDGLFAIMTTDRGDIVLELYFKDTPLTVTNFVGLAEGKFDAAKGKPFYNGLKFHRVIEDFMVQGGDPQGTGSGGPGYRFADEIVNKYQFDGPGVLAMANAGPGTNGSQFFITHVATPWLQGKHTIFGRVVTGQDVVNAIGQNDLIQKITIVRNGAEAQAFEATQDDFNAFIADQVKAEKDAAEAAAAEAKKMLDEKYGDFTEVDNGIRYKVLAEGKGSQAARGDNVSVHYKGYFLDGTVFDSSEGRGAMDFQVGVGRMIPGFDYMVLEMKEGEKRSVVLPPELAYGSQGAGGVIPPNAYIAFDIELLDVQ